MNKRKQTKNVLGSPKTIGPQLEFDWGRADFLVPPGGIMLGIASIMDIGGTLEYFNSSPTDQKADSWALSQDWYCVGDAFRNAFLEDEENDLLQVA